MEIILQTAEEKYILTRKIGDGNTCECYEGHKYTESSSSSTKEKFAIKLFNEANKNFCENEINFLKKLNSDKLFIKLYSYGQGYIFENEDTKNNNESNSQNIIYYQILEYAKNGSLYDYIKTGKLPENYSAHIFYEIAQALKYIHDKNISHCDIKPENILFTNNDFYPKIIDFGYSESFCGKNENTIIHNSRGTPIYSSPDIRFASTKGYCGIKSDIFSLGVLLFVINMGIFPFEIANNSDANYKFILSKKYKKFWDKFPDNNLSEELKDLINKMICIDPVKRLTIDEILTHPWVVNKVINENKRNEKLFKKEYVNELQLRKNLIN